MHATLTRRLASDACVQSRGISYLQRLGDTLEHFHSEILRRAAVDPNILKRRPEAFLDNQEGATTRLDSEDVRSKKRLQVLRTVRGDNLTGLDSGVSKSFADTWKRASEYDEYDFMLYYERRDRSMWAYSVPKYTSDQTHSPSKSLNSSGLNSPHSKIRSSGILNQTASKIGHSHVSEHSSQASHTPKSVVNQEDVAKRLTNAAVAAATSTNAGQSHGVSNGPRRQGIVSNLFGRGSSNAEDKSELEGVSKGKKAPPVYESVDSSISAQIASQNHAMLDGELSSDGEGEDRVSFALPSPYSPYSNRSSRGNSPSSSIDGVNEKDTKGYKRSHLAGISSLNIATPPYPLGDLPKIRQNDKSIDYGSVGLTATVRNSDISKNTATAFKMDSSHNWSFIPGMRSVASSGAISRHPPRPVPARTNPDWSSIFGSHIPSKNPHMGSELSRLLNKDLSSLPPSPSESGKLAHKSAASQTNRAPPNHQGSKLQSIPGSQVGKVVASANHPKQTVSQKESRNALTSLAALVGSTEGLSKEAVISVFSRQPGPKKR